VTDKFRVSGEIVLLRLKDLYSLTLWSPLYHSMLIGIETWLGYISKQNFNLLGLCLQYMCVW